MKSIEEQIGGKCIHFNGISNKTCKLGIAYDDVRVPDVKPYQWPCITIVGDCHGGHCDHCQFPTEQEIQAKIAEIQDIGSKSLLAMLLVKQHISETGKSQGTIPCNSCDGKIEYAQASNGHVRAACRKCGMSWVE